jgi:hypothetical protein
MKKHGGIQQGASKRTLEGTNLSCSNSFAILDNDCISAMAKDMGVNILNMHFDLVEIMKDLEVAMHALDKQKRVDIIEPNDNIPVEDLVVKVDHPMLEWTKECSEIEQFTLVQSRKKKKKRQSLLKNLRKVIPISRSSRTTPSVYRKLGDQENPATLTKQKLNCST